MALNLREKSRRPVNSGFMIVYLQSISEEIVMPRVELAKQSPEFTALDFNGTAVSLSDFAGRMNVLLVFNRSFS